MGKFYKIYNYIIICSFLFILHLNFQEIYKNKAGSSIVFIIFGTKKKNFHYFLNQFLEIVKISAIKLKIKGKKIDEKKKVKRKWEKENHAALGIPNQTRNKDSVPS